MTIKTFCRWAVIVNLFVCFLLNVYRDFNGQEQKSPQGFKGFIGTLLASTIISTLLYGAGLFDE